MPLIAAGGIGSGESILAAMALGADGVQIAVSYTHLDVYKRQALKNVCNDFKEIIVKTIQTVILPLLPIYIFGCLLYTSGYTGYVACRSSHLQIADRFRTAYFLYLPSIVYRSALC